MFNLINIKEAVSADVCIRWSWLSAIEVLLLCSSAYRWKWFHFTRRKKVHRHAVGYCSEVLPPQVFGLPRQLQLVKRQDRRKNGRWFYYSKTTTEHAHTGPSALGGREIKFNLQNESRLRKGRRNVLSACPRRLQLTAAVDIFLAGKRGQVVRGSKCNQLCNSSYSNVITVQVAERKTVAQSLWWGRMRTDRRARRWLPICTCLWLLCLSTLQPGHCAAVVVGVHAAAVTPSSLTVSSRQVQRRKGDTTRDAPFSSDAVTLLITTQWTAN